MRKQLLFLTFAFVLILSTGSFAQQGVVSIDHTTFEYTPTQLRAGSVHEVFFNFDYTANVSANFWIGSNAWMVYSPDGADWAYLKGTVLYVADGGIVQDPPLGPTVYKKHYNSADGVTFTETTSGGADLAGPSTGVNSAVGWYFATVSFGSAGAVSGVTNGLSAKIEFTTDAADHLLSMCVAPDLDGAMSAWQWASASLLDVPLWDDGLGGTGPRCWEIYDVPNEQPVWCAASDARTVNHCGEVQYDLCATDPDATVPDANLIYSFAPGFETGYGTITGNHFVFNGTDAMMPQSGSVDIDFVVNDTKDDAATYFTLQITVTNQAPVFTLCPAASVTVSAGALKVRTIGFSDPDVCDAPTISFGANTGGDAGDVWVIDGNDIEFTPELAGTTVAHSVTQEIIVTDGELTASCVLAYDIIVGSPYQVEIEKVEGQLQGQYADVAISLFNVDPNQGIGGFDFLVAYDASALSFQLAYEGDIYASHGWEYFTYRYGAYGNCGNACPSGMLSLYGMAEANNGITSATNLTSVDPVVKPTLAFMRFLVSNDRNMECQYIPIRFFWYDCTNNIISNFDGSEAYLSAKVFDFFELGIPFTGGEITGLDPVFPTATGTEAGCINDDIEHGKIAKPNVDFQNGGIDIICADDIDARGDINLNGLEYEIADAVMFTNYFISGLNAFADCTGLLGTELDACLMKQEGSIAASDTNADGIPLTVADLVYLIRVVIGDAQPYPKAAPVAANVTYGNGIFGVDVEMGAAHIVMAGNVVPELLDNSVEMRYASNGDFTNILIFSREANRSFSGNFLRVQGEVVSTEFATFLGAPVVAKVMPSDFMVHQNYPNPFNPTTTIKIDVPTPGVDWKLNIYNVTGQLVDTYSGVSTGFDEVVWDASELSSGIYFYKVTAGDQSMTKKAVLLK